MKKVFCILMFLIPIVVLPQWVWKYPLPTDNKLSSVWFTNANTGYAVGDSGTILKTINAGSTWITLSSGTTNNLLSVYFTGTDTGYVVGAKGTILKTMDAGTIWNALSSGVTGDLTSVNFFDVNTGYAVGWDWLSDTNIIIKTTNGGVIWTHQTITRSFPFSSVYFINADTGFILGGIMNPYDQIFGVIEKTNNGGTIWTDITNMEMSGYDLISIYFTDSNTGYIVGSSGLIFKTTNCGAGWTVNNIGTTNALNSVYFTDADTGYIVGISGMIFKTTNGGDQWTRQITETSEDLNSVYFTDAKTCYAVGQNGMILKTTNGGGTGTNEIPVSSKLLKIYPNPAIDKIIIETSGVSQESNLAIVNTQGQELILRQMTEPKTQIDISNLPSGVYFVRVTNDKTVEVGKFVKE
jgi:photosystem II stability/assembly factor-like uncharacterized protein